MNPNKLEGGNIRRNRQETIYADQQIEDLALRIIESEEICEAVKRASNKMEAITTVRSLLPQLFPEIENIPEPIVIRPGLVPSGPASNELKVARHVVDLLWEDR